MALWAVVPGGDDRRGEYATAQRITAVGWSRTGDLADVSSHGDVRERLQAAYPDTSPDTLDAWADQLWSFVGGIADGDMVATRFDPGPDVTFGRVTGPYRFAPSAPEHQRHQHPVEWVRRTPWVDLDPGLRHELQTRRAVHRVRDPSAARTDGVPARRLSRRAFVGTGAAAAVAAALAAIWRPWDSSGTVSTSSRHPVRRRTVGSTSTTAQSPNGPTAQWIKNENAKPGTTAWNVTNGGKPGDIEGYAGAVSAQKGDAVALYVSTNAPTYHVEAYRLGYYGGAGGRLVFKSPEQVGQKQAAPTFTPGINMTEARWNPSLRITIDDHYPPGVYVFKLTSATGVQQLIPLTVRDDTSTAAYAVQNSVTSWQAYNDWAGYSLYQGQNGAFATRSRVVSFDRPYARGDGQADFLGLEFPLIMLMEQLGLDVTYLTDVDTHLRPQLLTKHQAFFSLGHDEYWSKEMRDGVEAARDKGVNLAFLGTNAALTTVNWRDAPVARPESQMIGQQYECNPVMSDMIIVDPNAWIFSGANVKAGQHLTQAVGSEYDRFDPGQQGPKNVQLLAHSPVVCHGRPSFADMAYYTAPSGAGVFSTGTIVWITKLTPPGPGSPNDPVVVQAMKNVLAAFGTGPAGRQHPSVSNYDAVAAQYGKSSGGATGAD